MTRWMRPSEEMPRELDCGDRILGVVYEAPPCGRKVRPHLILLEATEYGWRSPDPFYSGYSVTDCEFWAHEKDVACDASARAAWEAEQRERVRQAAAEIEYKQNNGLDAEEMVAIFVKHGVCK